MADSDAWPSARVARIVFRLVFFVSAAAILAIACRQRSSMIEVGVAFVVYVIAGTLWVRGQHQASVDAATSANESMRPWTFPYSVSLLLVGIGSVVGWIGLRQDSGTALLAGVLSAFFGVGYVVMRFRINGGTSRVPVGVVLVAVSAVLVLLGLGLMDGYSWAVWLLAAGLLLTPTGLTVLAEPAVSRLQENTRIDIVLGLGVVGLSLVVGSAWIAHIRVGTAWIVVALLVLAVLVLAIVSSTQADIAAVIAAVALMGVTPMAEDKPLDLKPELGQQRVLVALGDSYMSGEGAQIYYNEEADLKSESTLNRCHRAPTAWAAIAGQTDRLFDSVAFLACSGARTYNVRHEDPPLEDGQASKKAQFNEPATQLDQVDMLKETHGEKFAPSLVVLSLGGNDAGFSTIGAMCIAPGDCSQRRDLWEKTLDQVHRGLTATYKEIREEFSGSPVLVTGYPNPIFSDEGGNAVKCDQVALSQNELSFISEFVAKLNDTIEDAALAQRFYFLDAAEGALADAHLQLCDPENDARPGVNFIGLRSVAGIAEQRFNPKNWYHNSLHPNARGHSALLQVFEEWRAQNPSPTRDNPTQSPRSDDDPSSADQQPLCDLIEDDQSNNARCRDIGAAWARGQLSDIFIEDWWGLQVLAVALGAWLLGVAFYGWRKPWWPDPEDPDAGSDR